MTDHYILTLSLLKIVTVLFGGAFLLITMRAFLRHRSRGLFVLIVAVGLLTTAAVAEGLVVQLFDLDLDDADDLGLAHLVEAAFTLAGFAVLLASVVSHRVTVQEEAGPLDGDVHRDAEAPTDVEGAGTVKELARDLR